MNFPIEFNVSCSSISGISLSWKSKYDGGLIKCSIPNCFEGPGDGASPEDFYALALLNCFIATFKIYAEKSKLSYEKIEGNAKLAVEKNSSNFPSLGKVILNFYLFSVDKQDRAERILNKVKSQSILINSVKSKVEINWSFE